MYQFHGWVMLQIAEHEDEFNELGIFDAKCAALAAFLQANPSGQTRREIQVQNGSCYLVLHGVVNRRRGEADDLKQLLHRVVEDFPASHGLVYEFDEQQCVADGRGVYSVTVIRRGACHPALDPFLSPFFPVVEDESC